MESVKFKLGKDFEGVPNFQYFGLDYGLSSWNLRNYRLFSMGGELYGLCCVDPRQTKKISFKEFENI